MKKSFITAILLLMLAALFGCGTNAAKEELEENDTDKAEAKVDTEEEESSVEEVNDDIWTYYDNATWSEDFNGLKMEIQKAVVTNKAPTVEDENAEESAVGIKFRMENTTDHKFTTYPDQARLVTSTGEQIDMPDMWVSDNLGGEIDKGVIKEGNIIWYLERGEADKIEWIKLDWYAYEGDEMSDSPHKDFEVELQLK